MKRLKTKKKVDLFLPETVNNQNDYGFEVTFKDDGSSRRSSLTWV